MADFTDLSELNDVPSKPTDVAREDEERDEAHRRVQREAMKAAKRAGEREAQDEADNDEFKNIGPV